MAVWSRTCCGVVTCESPSHYIWLASTVSGLPPILFRFSPAYIPPGKSPVLVLLKVGRKWGFGLHSLGCRRPIPLNPLQRLIEDQFRSPERTSIFIESMGKRDTRFKKKIKMKEKPDKALWMVQKNVF